MTNDLAASRAGSHHPLVLRSFHCDNGLLILFDGARVDLSNSLASRRVHGSENWSRSTPLAIVTTWVDSLNPKFLKEGILFVGKSHGANKWSKL